MCYGRGGSWGEGVKMDRCCAVMLSNGKVLGEVGRSVCYDVVQ